MAVNDDLYLDPKKHDLVISRYDLNLVRHVQSTAQRLKVKLKVFFAEWFLNRQFGVPYYESVLKKAPDLQLIEAEIKRAILKVDKVVEILEFSLEFDTNQRRLFIAFRVRTTEGDIELNEDIGL